MPAADLHIDELHFPTDAVWVEQITGRDVDPTGAAARPHRHEFHEILWIRSGRARHVIDGNMVDVGSGTVLVIGRRQVHRYLYARKIEGTAVRFGDDLARPAHGREAMSPVLRRAGGAYDVPSTDVSVLESLLGLLDEDACDRDGRRRQAMGRHLLNALLALLAGWTDHLRPQMLAGGRTSPADTQLYDRFVALLEESYVSERGARYYADALGVSQASLGRVVSDACGYTVKTAILQRALTEADRLLRYTDLTVGAIAARVGFDDPFYFSRLFKRHRGISPIEFRRRAYMDSHELNRAVLGPGI